MASSSVVPRESQLDNSLYQMVKPAVWVLKVSGTKKMTEVKVERLCTAFAVNSQGVIISCAHVFSGLDHIKIEAVGLDTEGFTPTTIIEIRERWDLCLMQVEGIVDCKIVKLATDGSLYQGERLICIANLRGYDWSFGLGYALFPCVQEEVTIPTGFRRCDRHDPSSSMEVTPKNRVMGDIWNKVTLSIIEGSTKKDDYCNKLHPSIPIIQCGDISIGVGCLGAPVINMQGEVVGMLASDDRADQIAIHVTLIKSILKMAEILNL